MTINRPLICSLLVIGSALPTTASGEEKAASSAASVIFEKRILPIFRSPKPSSCVECHLSGVELKDYIRPSEEATFAALRSADLIDIDRPLESKILTFIRRKPEKGSLLSPSVRKQEEEAFSAWIVAAAKDSRLLATTSNSPIGPSIPPEVIRHARKDRVLSSFVDNVWSEVARCAACHSPLQNQKQVKEHGKRVSWIKPNDPEATLELLVENAIVDIDKPLSSPLLTKPTMQVKHGGGQKMVVGDRTYKQFRAFLEDYAATAEGKYSSANELPKPSDEIGVACDIWFKVQGLPPDLDQKLLQVDIHRLDAKGKPSKERWATADRPIFGKGRLWQNHLSLTAPRDSRRAEELKKSPALSPGRYVVKLYLDRTGRLQKDHRETLGPDDVIGTVEVRSDWPAGYGSMTVVEAPKISAGGRK